MSAIEHARAYVQRGWQPVPIPAGRKGPVADNWQNRGWQPEEFGFDDNVGVILGTRSSDLVDIDLDCREALAIDEIYLPPTSAVFGRPAKPGAHRLYIATGARKEAFADPTNGEMLLELRADGRDGAGHQTLFPPSIADGERRAWVSDNRPVAIDTATLRQRCAWLAVACLVMRHVSETAARRPGHDLPHLLYEADRGLGRKAFSWLGMRDPEAPQYQPKRREDLTATEATLWELAQAIPNSNLGWDDWNAFGLAFFAASDGSSEGFIAFDRFSAQCDKYNGPGTVARWNHYHRSPHNATGLGKLIAAAIAAGWRSPLEHRRAAK